MISGFHSLAALLLLMAPSHVVTSTPSICTETATLSSPSTDTLEFACGSNKTSIKIADDIQLLDINLNDSYVDQEIDDITLKLTLPKSLQSAGHIETTNIQYLDVTSLGSSMTRPKVDFDTDLRDMTGLDHLSLMDIDIPNNWTLPSSMRSFSAMSCGLRELHLAGSFTLETFDVLNNKFRTIPKVVFNMVKKPPFYPNMNMDGSDLGPLTLSESTMAKLDDLLKNQNVQFGEVSSFTGECAGTTRLVTFSKHYSPATVCVIKDGSGDEIGIENDSGSVKSTSSAAPSTKPPKSSGTAPRLTLLPLIVFGFALSIVL